MPGNLPAIHDDDFEAYMTQLGVRGRLRRGDLRCFACDDILTLSSIAAVFPDSGAIKAVCAKPACLTALARWRDEKRNG